MVWRQALKAKLGLTEGNRGNKKVRRFLGVTRCHQTGIGPSLSRFADGIRVEHEIHSRNASTATTSSGIRGGSQSVVPRTEASHVLSFSLRWRAVPLRHQGWERRFAAVPFACWASSQPNNSLAWEADNFLTFLTASSTALIRHTLPG